LAADHGISDDSGIELVYPGKIPEAELLATVTPTMVAPAWTSSGQPVRDSDNHLYHGDNIGILAGLLSESQVAGKVRLIYIDPPYATNSIFQSRSLRNAYADLLTGPRYLEFVRQRLILLRELLADDGSIYVHLDENMVFQVKTVMDEIFGRKNFRNFITRKKCSSKNYTRKTYGNVADYVLFYSRSSSYVWNLPRAKWSEEHALKEYPYVEAETGRRFKKVPVHAPGVRKGETGRPWRGMHPPLGRHWKCAPSKLDELDQRGEIYWSANGNPRKKVYLDESAGVPITDIWLDCRDAHNQNVRITGYPTEKNAEMLERIVAASSNEGDLVLDCFCGSGTTLAAADGLGRRWIGVDSSWEAILASLERLLHGPRPMSEVIGGGAPKGRQLLLGERTRDFTVLCEPKESSEIRAAIEAWMKRTNKRST
jgi:adenine-specific DNA-methyltransferase